MTDDHPDLAKLQVLGKAYYKRDGRLPSVRKDSPEWRQWRQWFKDRGVSMAWAEKQADDYHFTVVTETPPVDLVGALEALKKPWTKLKT